MTVSTQVSRNEYTGNGATTQYDFTFRILDQSYLLVQTIDTSENLRTLVLGTDYTVTGVNRYPGGKVVLSTALPTGYKISIERSTPVTQETSIRNQGGFFPEIHEDAFDKLTMLVQQMFGWWSGLALKKPSWLANYYDAQNNRIRNLRDPSQAQDAATKNYVDSADSGLQQQITSNFNRSLRVPESSISVLPTVSGRKNKILAFNSSGSPIPVLPESGSAADVLINLASNDGFKLVGQVTSYAELQSIVPEYAGQRILLQSYSAGWAATLRGPEGGGEFVAFNGSVDDDAGYLCQPTGTTLFHWRRVVNSMTLTPEMFGGICDSQRQAPGTDSTDAINKMFASAIRRNNTVKFSSMTSGSNEVEQGYYVTSAILATGIHVIKGDPLFHYASATFDQSKGAYCLCLGDPATDRTTIQNGLRFGTITTRDLSRRAVSMGGIYIKYTDAKGITLRAFDANGNGVRMAPVYDSRFGITTERCGNITDYAIYTDGNGDECNTIVFTSILCHDSYHKGIFIAGSKHSVLNVHCEATAVLTTDDGYTGLTGATTSTGLKYVNHVFYLVGGSLGNINFNDYGNTNGKTYYGEYDTLNAADGSHVAIALVKSTADNIINEIITNSGGNIGRVSLFSANTQSAIKNISAGHLYFESSSRFVVDSVTANTLYSWSTFTKIHGGRITNWGSRVIAAIQDATIDASSMIDPLSYVNCLRCKFNNTLTHFSSSTLNKFTDCYIPGITLTDTSLQELATFVGCDVGATAGVTLSGGTASSLKSLTFRGCTLRGTWTGATAYDGIRFLSGNVPGATYSLGTWFLPRQTRPGTTVYKVKSSYISGEVVASLCLTVDSSGINTWYDLNTIS
ncbi:phage tail fiber protein [Klebsiella pneumoniae]|uniref:phage tail fiber domain-containing protein n=1 Tax=Klebsiella pneumoniae TaxID=573 RepID=UPI0022DF34B7|nr:phage tail fiber protein [Klebsiella pneumoniae]